MAKLEIKKIEGTDGLTMRDYHILVDGHEPTYLTGIDISINIEEINHAAIFFNVEDLQVDGDFLALVKAKVNEKECSQ